IALISIALLALLVTAASAAMKAASDELYASIELLGGRTPTQQRTAVGTWLAPRLVTDVAPDNVSVLSARAFQLSYRAERSREAASVLALLGLLLALF